MRPKVTVYVTCHNYGRFLQESLDSVFAQNMTDWEMLVIDDGSQDNSQEIIQKVVAEHPDRVRAFHNEQARGLPYCANLALNEAYGEYIMRLDADDYLDESALLILSTHLDNHPDVALVYPNFIYVDEKGGYLGIENRKKIGVETEIFDLPAHGACTMGRKRMLKSVGGYSEDFNAQDGHELWLKILHRYKVSNIATPLFSYRQHSLSLTRNVEKILKARQEIKRAIAKRMEGKASPRVVGIIPAKNTYENMPNRVLELFHDKSLIDYTIEAAYESETFDTVFLTTDDPNVLKHCEKFPELKTNLRTLDLSQSQVKISQVISDAVHHLETDHGIFPDILVLLNVHCPLRKPTDIRKAVDTLLVYDVDSVISVYEDFDLHFKHGSHGMEPLNKGTLNSLRLERESLYVDNGAIRVVWRDMVSEKSYLGEKSGHIVMPQERSYVVSSDFDRWLIEEILKKTSNSNLQKI